MSADSPQPTAHQDSGGCSRRGYLQRVAVAGGTIATLGAAGEQVAPQYSPVGRAEAIAPIVVAGGAAAVGGSAAIGWALREYEVVGSDDPPEGLTPEVLLEENYQTARTRKSNDHSTFVDNMNIVDAGIEHAAYGDGKIAAIESLNAEESQSSVLDSAQSEANIYEQTVITNFLKSWNETALEFEKIWNSVRNHSEIDVKDVFSWQNYPGTSEIDSVDLYVFDYDYEFTNGNTFTVKTLVFHDDTGSVRSTYVTNPAYYFSDRGSEDLPAPSSMDDVLSNTENQAPGDYGVLVYDNTADGSSDNESEALEYLVHSNYHEVLTAIESVFNDVRDGLALWVNSVYSDVQAGELDTEELLSPRELAEMTADDEEFNQAVSDLMALNVAVDLEREATIALSEQNATLKGQIAVSSDVTINSGDTITPSSDSHDYYFTYDVSTGEGTWEGYDDSRGIDGGKLYFTAEPFPQTLYQIDTAAGETVTATESDFTPLDADGNEIDNWSDAAEWVVDLSADLETAITDVEQIRYFAETEETQYETVQLTQSFTVEKIENSDGEEVDSLTVESNQPQDDTNYITEEEWQEMQQRQEELIEKYEDAQSGGGLGWFDGTDLEGYGGPIVGALVVFAGIVGIGQLSN